MHKFVYSVCAAMLATAVSVPCFAADSPWAGTWKLNEARSKMTGNTFTVSSSPDGSMMYDNGSTVKYKFACDGKDYPTTADRTIACTRTSDTEYHWATKKAGTVLGTSVRTISANGKTLTIVATGTQPDGATFKDTTTFTRVSGTTGLAGKWKSVTTASSTPDIFMITVNGDMMHTVVPGFKEVADNKLDGTDATMTGPTVPAGATLSLKSESPTKLKVLYKLSGKVMDEGTYVLSADGKTMVEEDWIPGKMAEKETLVYEKQ